MSDEQNSNLYALSVLELFQADPVLSLERAFPPTHALVRSVYASESSPFRAMVEFELIDQPPAPTTVHYGGAFVDSTFNRALLEDDRELPWFAFDATLPIEMNVARMRAHIRDSIALFGARGGAPLCREELELAMSYSGADRKAVVRKRRRAPPPPEPPPPPEATARATPPPAAPSSPPSRREGRRREEPPAPPLRPSDSNRRRSLPPSIPPPPPEPPPPDPFPRRQSYRPPEPAPDSMPTRIHRRPVSNQPPPEPPPPPPIKRD